MEGGSNNVIVRAVFLSLIILIFLWLGEVILWPQSGKYIVYIMAVTLIGAIILYILGWFTYKRKSQILGWIQIAYSFIWCFLYSFLIYVLLCGRVAPASQNIVHSHQSILVEVIYLIIQPVAALTSFNVSVFYNIGYKKHLYTSIVVAIAVTILSILLVGVST